MLRTAQHRKSYRGKERAVCSKQLTGRIARAALFAAGRAVEIPVF